MEARIKPQHKIFMKHLDEYRQTGYAKKLLDEIHVVVKNPWSIMEICGGQTHSLVKNGILDLLPDNVQMIHGPGCPVCVTPAELIDQAISIAENEDVILCSFGDMIRVPGSAKSLLKAKSEGCDIHVVYSPLEAVATARQHPDKQIVFFAVGFETTAPANALSVLQADKLGLKNYSILSSQVLVPPAMAAIVQDKSTRIDGFLAAGHVCTVMGTGEYQQFVETYKLPVVVTGFESVDLLQGILSCVKQLESGDIRLENQYSRVVRNEGNVEAKRIIEEIFEVADRHWRGIGVIPASGWEVREKYQAFDAKRKFKQEVKVIEEDMRCIAGEILKGIRKPHDCGEFGKGCTPANPLGAPMVSSEGACAAYFQNFEG